MPPCHRLASDTAYERFVPFAATIMLGFEAAAACDRLPPAVYSCRRSSACVQRAQLAACVADPRAARLLPLAHPRAATRYAPRSSRKAADCHSTATPRQRARARALQQPVLQGAGGGLHGRLCESGWRRDVLAACRRCYTRAQACCSAFIRRTAPSAFPVRRVCGDGVLAIARIAR